MKAKVKRLLELLEHNTHSLWDTNLRYTTDCIILEDKELKDMVYEEDTEESDFKNHIFNGNELCKLIEELKKEVSLDPESLSQDRLVCVVEKTMYTSEPKIFETEKELVKWLREVVGVDEENNLTDEYIINESYQIGEIKQVKRKDIGSPNTRN